MVLEWWQIWCLTHLHLCGSSWWMVSSPSLATIHSILFHTSLDPNKKSSAAENTSLVWHYTVLYRITFFKCKFMGYTIIFLDFTCFLNTKMHPIPKVITRLPSLCSLLCLNLLPEIKMPNSSICLNRSRDASLKQSKAFCLYEVPDLDLAVDRSIRNCNYLTTNTTNKSM